MGIETLTMQELQPVKMWFIMALEEDKRQQVSEFTTPPDRFSTTKINSINWD